MNSVYVYNKKKKYTFRREKKISALSECHLSFAFKFDQNE